MEKLFQKFQLKPVNHLHYQIAFNHSTYTNENPGIENYERYEFLGDALIEFEISLFLFQQYHLDEGEMTLVRAKNVNADSLAKISLKLGLEKYIKLGKGAKNLCKNSSILSDVFESFVAAVYLDLGRNQLLKVLRKTLFAVVKKNWNSEIKDSKTLLQEYFQASKHLKICYDTQRNSNDDFISKVKYDKLELGTGIGKSKKMAEQESAKAALKKLV